MYYIVRNAVVNLLQHLLQHLLHNKKGKPYCIITAQRIPRQVQGHRRKEGGRPGHELPPGSGDRDSHLGRGPFQDRASPLRLDRRGLAGVPMLMLVWPP